jgi:hypothetical protein
MVCGWAGVLGQGPVADQVVVGFRDVAIRVVVGEGHEAAAALALQQHGPKPIEKPLTRMPCQVAERKWPASCTTIRPDRAVSTPIQVASNNLPIVVTGCAERAQVQLGGLVCERVVPQRINSRRVRFPMPAVPVQAWLHTCLRYYNA